MKYQWILFDADETLFHFDAFNGLRLLFESYGIEFTNKDYQDYQEVNLPLWQKYQNGCITASQLQHIRFSSWATQLKTTTEVLNQGFLSIMAEICRLLPGANELLDRISAQANMGIITNGFVDLQQARLQKLGLESRFHPVIISEMVGVAKPDVAIFDHAFAAMNYPSKNQILMVGDNPHSDILGGNNAGIDTCWLNSKGADCPEGVFPSFEVRSLSELQRLLFKS